MQGDFEVNTIAESITEIYSAATGRIKLSKPVREAGGIFLATRGGLILFAPLAYLALTRWIPDTLHVAPPTYRNMGNFPLSLKFLVGPWNRWDAGWYLDIAKTGYFSPQSTAFFPLYPLLTALLGPLFLGNLALAGLILSLGCCLAAFIMLYKLVQIDFGPRIAWRTTFLLAIFPTSFFFQAIYTESLFLLLTIACLYAARRQHYVVSGLLALLAVLTRSTGLMLILPMAIMYFKNIKWNWRQIDLDATFLLYPFVGLGLWMTYLGAHFHDPWLFSEVQREWSRSFISPLQGGPFNALYQGFNTAFVWSRDIPGDLIHSFWPNISNDPGFLATQADLDFGFSFSFIVLSIAAFWWLPWEYPVYSLALILMPASFPHIPSNVTSPLFSMPRFVLPAFPVFLLLAIWSGQRRWFFRVVTTVFLLLLLLLCCRFILMEWVA